MSITLRLGIFGFLYVSALVISSCGGGRKMELPPEAPDAAFQGGKITFDKNILPLVKNKCASCHNSGSTIPNWLDYQTAFQKREKIFQRVVVEKSMPKAPFNLSDAERKIVAAWIEQGAPKNDDVATPIIIPPGPVEVPTQCSEQFNTELFTAITAGKSDDVKLLLAKGACPNAKNAKGQTALILAINSYDGQTPSFLESGKALVAYKADVNVSYAGASALDWAEYNDERDVALAMIENGADVSVAVAAGAPDPMTDMAGFTPLLLAVRNGNPSEVTSLLVNGADLSIKTVSGKTAASIANDLNDGPKKDAIVELIKQYSDVGALKTPSYNRDVLPILKNRCFKCHNTETPRLNWTDYNAAYRFRSLIYVRAVEIKDMPVENETKITDDERVLIGKWIKAGANK